MQWVSRTFARVFVMAVQNKEVFVRQKTGSSVLRSLWSRCGLTLAHVAGSRVRVVLPAAKAGSTCMLNASDTDSAGGPGKSPGRHLSGPRFP